MAITQNGVLKRDENDSPVMGGTSSVDNQTIINSSFDPTTRRLLTDSAAGSGTVTSVSVVTANGFAGTVATATTTPAITLSTTVTGILSGNGTSISAATTTGSGSVVLATAPSISGATITTSSVNGVTLTTGGSTSSFLNANGVYSTPAAASLVVGTTAITSGTATRILYDNAGVLGEYTLTGSGTVVVMQNTPTLTTPVLGVATATSINKMAITAPATSSTLAVADGKTFTVNNTMTLAAGADGQTWTFPSTSDTVAVLGTAQTFTAVKTFTPAARSSGTASYFIINVPADTGQTASTESIGFKTVTATRTWATTGTVALQRENYLAGVTYASAGASQTFTDIATLYVDKPIAGTNAVFTRAHSVAIVDSTSAASSITGGFVIATTLGTTATSVGIGGGNINAGGTLTVGGHVTLEGVTSTGATGTGLLVFGTTPTLTTPVLGVATATSINKMAITAPATSSTLAVADGKTFTVNNTITLAAGADSQTFTFPAASATIAGLATNQTFTGQVKMNNEIDVNNVVTVTTNAGTVPITFKLNTFTNSSAATMAITMATASAVDGQMTIVRIYDFSAVAQTIGWTNTENSTVSVPTTSNGSTTLPLTVGFMYNTQTSKWRCIALA